jgi:hypothetical protein
LIAANSLGSRQWSSGSEVAKRKRATDRSTRKRECRKIRTHSPPVTVENHILGLPVSRHLAAGLSFGTARFNRKQQAKKNIFPAQIFLGELETSFWPGSNYHPHPSPVIARSQFKGPRGAFAALLERLWTRIEALRRRDSRPVDWGESDGNAGGCRHVQCQFWCQLVLPFEVLRCAWLRVGIGGNHINTGVFR